MGRDPSATIDVFVSRDMELMPSTKSFVENDCARIWFEIDFNGNGIISVAELRRFIEAKLEEHPVLRILIDENTGTCKQSLLIRAWAKISGYIGGRNAYDEGYKDGLI